MTRRGGGALIVVAVVAAAGCEALVDAGALSSGGGDGGVAAPDGSAADDARAPLPEAALDAPIGDGAPSLDGASGSAYRAAVLGDAPLAYWRMGITTGAVVPDETGHGNDLVLRGGSETLGAPGALAKDPDTAIAFDGVKSFATAVDPTPFAFLGRAPFTLECWAKYVPLDGGSYYEHLVSQSTGDTTNRSGYIFYTAPQIPSPIASLEIDVPGGQQGPFTTVSAPVTGFVHYVAVFDGASARVFTNAAPGSPDTISGNQVARDADLIVAADHDVSALFSGVIDEVAIYDKALTQEQISAHYFVGRGQ